MGQTDRTHWQKPSHDGRDKSPVATRRHISKFLLLLLFFIYIDLMRKRCQVINVDVDVDVDLFW